MSENNTEVAVATSEYSWLDQICQALDIVRSDFKFLKGTISIEM